MISTRVVEAKPRDMEVRRLRAFAYTQTGQADKALADLNAILKDKPTDAATLNRRADTYFQAQAIR